MATLLQINSSIFSAGGQSSRLAEDFVAAWRATYPHGTVIVRDLAKDVVPHLDADRFGAFVANPAERTEVRPVGNAVNDARHDDPDCLEPPYGDRQASLF